MTSENAREWFEQKPEPIPGQLDLFGTAESTPDGQHDDDDDAIVQKVRERRQRRGKRATAVPRPASTQRPPERPMTVAEAVALQRRRRMEEQ